MARTPGMKNLVPLVCGLAVATLVVVIPFTFVEAAGPVLVTRFREIPTVGSLPKDLASPEGTTRWDLTGLPRGATWTRTISADGATVVVADEATGRSANRVVYSDPAGGDAARRWVLPHTVPETGRMGSTAELVLDVRQGPVASRLRIRVATVGIGWVHLPAGPHEVVLQRAIVEGEGDSTAAGVATLIHRWIDVRAGVVAEVSGPSAGDTPARLSLASAVVADSIVTGAADLKLYVGQYDRGTFRDVLYGWDRGPGVAISALTPQAYATIGDLIAANTWDFSGNTSGVEVASTFTPVDSSETCNASRCGYTVTGGVLERRDRAFGTPDLVKYNTVRQREDRANESIVWLRAGAQKEGKTGAFGTGESRICFNTESGTTRSSVPEWRFTRQDAGGFYLQAGDSWFGGPLNCEQNFFNQTCGTPQLFDKIWGKACGTHTGKQTGEVLKGGVVTTPSGHTFNALLTRTTADYCVYTDSFCIIKVDEVRTVVYLWTAPYIGTIARIQSVQNAADLTSWTSAEETDFKFGLFPPRTLSVTGTTDSTVSLSWDPGLDTHRISRYRIYWDTDSGSASAYGFDSSSNPGQVTFNTATSATISGLTPGTPYYFTITSVSDFTDPSSSVLTTYESLLYPTQVSGDPSFVYPVEVQGTTGCVPSQEATGLAVNRSGGGIQICWNPTSDPCNHGYSILGADSPTSASNFTEIGTTDSSTTCWSGNPTQRFFLVTVRGSLGNGPWGHFNR